MQDYLESIARIPISQRPWYLRQNYNDPSVQMMSQVSQNVQPWWEYGENYWKNIPILLPITGIASLNYIIIRGNLSIASARKKFILRIGIYRPHHGLGKHFELIFGTGHKLIIHSKFPYYIFKVVKYK